MCITYEVDGALYINLTNRCSNSCEFCIRKNGDGAYGSDSLWLVREPSADEAIEAVFSRDLTAYREIVFCGYGEPTEQLDVLCAVARKIKEEFPNIKVRVNTNGHSDLINGRDTTGDFFGIVDAISISLNTPSPEKYVEICHPIYKTDAFFALIDFAKRVKSCVPTVLFSVVRQTLTEEELIECEKIAADAGVTLRVRDYISADDDK